MPFESDSDLELHQHVELGLRTQSRGSSREAAAETSAGAPRVPADAHAPRSGLAPAPPERLGRLYVVLVV